MLLFPQRENSKPCVAARWTRRSRCAVVVLLALGALSGCADGLPERVPVSGVVLIDGQPLTQGSIMVIPNGQRPAGGTIGPDGRFTLTCYKYNDGVVPGTHRVTVQSNVHVSERETKWLVPKRYGDPSSSGLTITVDDPEEDVEINLTWDGRRPYVERM